MTDAEIACPWRVLLHEGEYVVQEIEFPFRVVYSNDDLGTATEFMIQAYDMYVKLYDRPEYKQLGFTHLAENFNELLNLKEHN